jgi:hypothetical protein
MSTTRKIAIGLGLAGGALLAAYLLTGNRKERTIDFVAKAGKKIKQVVTSSADTKPEESEPTYI